MARFEKGQSGNPATQFSGENAVEMQRRSAVARTANKHGRELMREMLRTRVVDPQIVEALRKRGYDPEEITNEVAMNERQIEKAQKTGDTKAYAAVMRVAGYDEQDINLHGDATIALTLSDPAAMAGLQRALDNGAKPRKPTDETER